MFCCLSMEVTNTSFLLARAKPSFILARARPLARNGLGLRPQDLVHHVTKFITHGWVLKSKVKNKKMN